MEIATRNLAQNLRWLCAREGSVSEVCRRIGVNRQQFARYLNGGNRPAAHNLQRICAYFDVEEEAIFQAPDVFTNRVSAVPEGPADMSLLAAFPGNRRALRHLLGRYHAHFRSPSQPGRIIRSLVDIVERDGSFQSRTVERLPDHRTGLGMRARYVGLVAQHGETIFLVERDRSEGRTISQTILNPMYRGSTDWLSGILSACAWSNGRPYASACLWRRLPSNTDLGEAIRRCGAIPIDDSSIDRRVIRFFAEGRENSGGDGPSLLSG